MSILNNIIVKRLICLLIGYICGMFLSGYFYGKSKDVDLTKEGSGNVGTTNALRILGIRAGAFTLLLDCLKTILACVIAYFLFRNNAGEEGVRILMAYAGFGAILGHDFPAFMKFRGGKGVASTLGLVSVCFTICLPIAIVVFVLAVYLSRYLSLGSILGMSVLFVEAILFSIAGILPYKGTALLEAAVILSLTAALSIFLHRSNIKRLLDGNENRFTFHPKNTKG